MTIETVTYAADGLNMVGELHLPDAGGPRPAILVFPEAFGLSEHAKSRARALAELGFVALACDLHGDGKVYTDLGEVMPLIGVLRADGTRLQERASAALKVLQARPDVDASRIAAIGFCFGGTMSLELVRGGHEIAAAIGFHSGLTAVSQGGSYTQAKVLAIIGADDPGIPPEQRTAFEQEMTAAKLDWQLHVLGGVVHSFTNPDADSMGRPEFARYDAAADARSWASMRALLDEAFA